jgi:hypothetical protein
VASILQGLGVETAVIGALALAVHKYVRQTVDLDLATSIEPFSALPAVQRALEQAGFTTDLRQPDADDPLGGVLEVTRKEIQPIEIVNFLNPLAPRAATLADEAIHAAIPGRIAGSSLRVVTLPHVIALKLYAGGPRSRNDVIELLERNQPLHPNEIRAVCARHGLTEPLEAILKELGLGDWST